MIEGRDVIKIVVTKRTWLRDCVRRRRASTHGLMSLANSH